MYLLTFVGTEDPLFMVVCAYVHEGALKGLGCDLVHPGALGCTFLLGCAPGFTRVTISSLKSIAELKSLANGECDC